MTAKTLTCIEISCDVCEYRLEEDHDGIEHFESIEEAIKNHATGESDAWIIHPNGYAICPADFDEDHDKARAALIAEKDAALASSPAGQIPGQGEIATARTVADR